MSYVSGMDADLQAAFRKTMKTFDEAKHVSLLAKPFNVAAYSTVFWAPANRPVLLAAVLEYVGCSSVIEQVFTEKKVTTTRRLFSRAPKEPQRLFALSVENLATFRVLANALVKPLHVLRKDSLSPAASHYLFTVLPYGHTLGLKRDESKGLYHVFEGRPYWGNFHQFADELDRPVHVHLPQGSGSESYQFSVYPEMLCRQKKVA